MTLTFIDKFNNNRTYFHVSFIPRIDDFIEWPYYSKAKVSAVLVDYNDNTVMVALD